MFLKFRIRIGNKHNATTSVGENPFRTHTVVSRKFGGCSLRNQNRLLPAILIQVVANAQGVVDAVFVIQINGALTAAAQSYVKLINGAQAKNVFWLVRSAAATWGVNSMFNGSVVGGSAIGTASGDSINGRLFTIAGAITTQGSVITADTSICGIAMPVSWIYFKGSPLKSNVVLE